MRAEPGLLVWKSGGRRLASVLLISSFLWACAGGGGGGGSSNTSVTGYVGDGPVENAVVNCFLADSAGHPADSINDSIANPYGVNTDSSGTFTLMTTPADGPVICTSTAGTDTVNNSPAPDLSVMIPTGVTPGNTVTANLTSLTTVATQIVQSGTTSVTSSTVSKALSTVANAFGLNGCDLLTLVPLVPPGLATCPAPANPNLAPVEKRYQQILDDLSGIATNGPNFSDLVVALATDLAGDLELDGLDSSTRIKIGATTTYLDQVISLPPGSPGSTTYSLLDSVIGLKFTPASSGCSANCVSMAENVTDSNVKDISNAGVLAIDVTFTNTTPPTPPVSVFGAAFDVDIVDSTVTQWNGSGIMKCTDSPVYVGCQPGGLLEGAPPVTYTVNLQDGTNANILIVGGSEVAPATGVTGSGTIIELKFQLWSGLGGTSSALNFNNNALYDSSAASISGVTWGNGVGSSPLGGTVTIVPYPNN